MDYMVIAQGKTSIPGVDDGEEMTLTDVRHLNWLHLSKLVAFYKVWKGLRFSTAHSMSKMIGSFNLLFIVFSSINFALLVNN